MSQAPTTQRQKLASSVPPVHGRPVPPVCVRTRLSNHQRNLSLDFRSVVVLDSFQCRVCYFIVDLLT